MGLGYGGDPYYNGYGYNKAYGYGSPYYGSSYGHSGISVGVGYGSGYYGSPYYGGYGYGWPYNGGYGYGSPYGWYNNFYYPGTGSYVYDTYRQPHVMTTTQRQYWATRTPTVRTARGSTTRSARPNWSAFNRQAIEQHRSANQAAREAREEARQDRRHHDQ